MNRLKHIQESNDLRQALVQLRQEMNNLQVLEEVSLELEKDDQWMHSLLKHDDPKVRRNIALILGLCSRDIDYPILVSTYIHEKQLFIREGLLKSLENYELDDEFIQYLFNREGELEALLATEDKKNAAAELRVLRTLLSTNECLEQHQFTHLVKEIPIVLTCLHGHSKLLMDEIDALAYKKVELGVQVKSNNLQQLYKYRLFNHMYLPIARFSSVDEKQIIDGLSKPSIVRFLDSCHQGESRYRFRIHTDLQIDVRKVALEIEVHSHSQLINQPDDYEVEFYLRKNKKDECMVYLRLMTIIDPRFGYRKYKSSTSLGCQTAAVICGYSKWYMKENSKVLDPYANDAVLLVERNKALTAHFLMGLNKSSTLMQYAEYNLNAAQTRAHLVQRELYNFDNEEKFDEIISNLPIAIKNEDREKNEKEYMFLFKKAIRLLNDKGMMFLHTSEIRLMTDLTKQFSNVFGLIDKIRILNGARPTYLYIYRKK